MMAARVTTVVIHGRASCAYPHCAYSYNIAFTALTSRLSCDKPAPARRQQ
jgi:hypothetical protein